MLDAGEGLSGGQRQALTVARALVKKPPIFIFDELLVQWTRKRNFIENSNIIPTLPYF